MTYFKSVKFIDDTGADFGVKQIDNKIRTSSMPYTYDIAEGNIAGHTAHAVLGYNLAVGGTLEDITVTGINVPMPSSALAIEVLSSSANDVGTLKASGTATGGSTSTLIDTGADFVAAGVAVGDIVLNDTDVAFGIVSVVAVTTLTVDPIFSGSSSFANTESYRVVNASGTGVSVVMIHGLDGSYAELHEFVLLNGASAVATSNNFLRINDFHSLHVGSAGSAVGSIDIRQVATPANIMDRIITTGNRSLQAFFTVPAGKTMFITEWSASASSTVPIRLFLRATITSEADLLPGVFLFQDIMLVEGSILADDFKLPIKVPEKADVKISGNVVTAGSGEAAASFYFWLE